MNTPAHLIFGVAAFGRPGRTKLTAAAFAGALAPDVSLYAMAGVSLFVLGISPDIVFGNLYYSSAWQQVFAIDNSFVLWGALFAVALWRQWPALVAFAGAALLHLAFDFPLHSHDARAHFWPISNWVFESPLSYWDSRGWADIIGPIEVSVSIALCVFLLVRFRYWAMRLSVVALGALELFASGIWRFVF